MIFLLIGYHPTARVNISNNWELVLGDEPIVYTIDISTNEGGGNSNINVRINQ